MNISLKDRGEIEVPADSDTVYYPSEDGQWYEISIDELKDYDGDDGEITYHNKSRNHRNTTNRRNNTGMYGIMPTIYSQRIFGISR